MQLKIPIKQMTLDSLDQMFPQLTPSQVADLRAGRPLRAEPTLGDYTIAPASTPLLTSLPAVSDAMNDRERDICVKILSERQPWTVSAILVFSDSRRMRRVLKSINAFTAQTYANKQLIVANASDTEVVLDPAPPEVVHVRFPTGTTVGAMRTEVLRTAVTGDVVYPHWDDDDHHDPFFLSAMMFGYKPGTARALTTQVRIDINDARVEQITNATGIPDSMLVPTEIMRHGYSDANDPLHDVKVWQGLARVIDRTVVATHEWPLTTLKVRVWDGNNLLSRDEFMSPTVNKGQWRIGAREQVYLAQLLERSGIKVIANKS